MSILVVLRPVAAPTPSRTVHACVLDSPPAPVVDIGLNALRRAAAHATATGA